MQRSDVYQSQCFFYNYTFCSRRPVYMFAFCVHANSSYGCREPTCFVRFQYNTKYQRSEYCLMLILNGLGKMEHVMRVSEIIFWS